MKLLHQNREGRRGGVTCINTYQILCKTKVGINEKKLYVVFKKDLKNYIYKNSEPYYDGSLFLLLVFFG